MDINKLDFRFLKVKNGKPFFAIVNLSAEQILSSNEIIENYSGNGFTFQGNIESVPNNGYDDWKIAANSGVKFVLNLSDKNWRVTINSLEGRIATDTNPTIIGYTTILALCNSINFQINDNLKEKIENFVFQSWDNDNDSKIPNFETLEYN